MKSSIKTVRLTDTEWKQIRQQIASLLQTRTSAVWLDRAELTGNADEKEVYATAKGFSYGALVQKGKVVYMWREFANE